MADVDFDAFSVSDPSVSRGHLSRVLKVIGSLISLGLLLGLINWGYNLSLSQSAVLPIIKASTGPLKVLPRDPGGDKSAYLGYAVNSVQEDGEVEGPSRKIILAPSPIGVDESDLSVLAGFGDSNGKIDLKKSINHALAEIFGTSKEIKDTISKFEISSNPISSTSLIVENLFLPLRPVKRPEIGSKGLSTSSKSKVVIIKNYNGEGLLFKKGESLAHLGSFKNLVIAQVKLDNFVTMYDDYLSDKTIFIQNSKSGGRSIFRMQIGGFSDLEMTNQFCSLIKSFGDDCMPVTYR